MVFNPNEYVIQLKSKEGAKDYLPVQYRLVWVNQDYETKHFQKLEITIKKSVIDLDRTVSKEIYAWNNETRRSEKTTKTDTGWAYYEMHVELVDSEGNVKIGEGSKSEGAVDFPDFIEKAQTGALGRALAEIGYGTQFAPELNEEHRIVDAPVERTSSNGNERSPLTSVRPATTRQDGQGTGEVVKPSVHAQNTQASQETHPEATQNAPATEQQLASIRKLCSHLGKPEPEDLDNKSYLQAKQLIADLSLEYRQSRKAS